MASRGFDMVPGTVHFFAEANPGEAHARVRLPFTAAGARTDPAAGGPGRQNGIAVDQAQYATMHAPNVIGMYRWVSNHRRGEW
jgi:hypothetical protein